MQKPEITECLKRMKEYFVEKPKEKTKGIEKYQKLNRFLDGNLEK